MSKKFYVTTPIYYASGKAHIGHVYSTVAADVTARYKRMLGYDVMFTTGMDEHGQKAENSAKKESKSPQDYVDFISEDFKKMWTKLNIKYDKFIRTTDKNHKEIVRKIFDKLYEKNLIYKSKYTGWYCTPCESFFTEKQIKENNNLCPDCGREVKWTEEEAYFFKLSEFGDKLLKYYKNNPEFLQPDGRLSEMIKFVESGLEDLCVTRTSFNWGIPVSFDSKHVIYVWLDALTNYITSQGYLSENSQDFEKYWPADVHFVGKEIVRFHAVIWPAILMALDLPLPKKIFGHGWILFGDGSKMSKSKGNVIDPEILCERYGVDAVRYFLMREFSFGEDGLFTNEALINRINFDLANDLGNLVSRTISMIDKYFNNTLIDNQRFVNSDKELLDLVKNTIKNYENNMNSFRFSIALSDVWLIISRCNKYIDLNTPWDLYKNPENHDRLACVLYNLCEALRIVSVLISPFMPETAVKIQEQLNISSEICTWDKIKNWGELPKNTTVNKSVILFPRIDVQKELEELENIILNNNTNNLIKIDEFFKTELIVGEILECEKVKKSKKLLKLLINDGTKNRTVVSGISLYYEPEDLINKKIILVSNLEPVKLCGVESQGMILASQDNNNNVKVIFVDNSIPAGSKIS